MNDWTVVLAEQRMTPELVQMAHEACARAGVDVHAWNEAGRVDGLMGRAAMAIGVLAAGARQIPSDLAGLVTDQLPGLPLLLLAEEPLVRPVVSLRDGLVTLVEPPLSTARLAGCVRALLAGGPPDPPEHTGWWPAIEAPDLSAPIQRREYRVGACWIGVLEGRGTKEAAPVTGPAAWLRTVPGLAAGISLDDPPKSTVPGHRGPWTGAHDLGAAAVVAHLETVGERLDWTFRTPAAGGALGLFSAQRLPAFTDFGRPRGRGESGPQRLTAAAGDIAVAAAPVEAWRDLGGKGRASNFG